MFRTSDGRQFEELNAPPNTHCCHGLLSAANRLFFLSFPLKTHDWQQHNVIFELVCAALPGDEVEWKMLKNSRCPVPRRYPAFFAQPGQSSLVLAGGHDFDTCLPVVSEYCLRTMSWLNASTWPALPTPVEQQDAVVIGSLVHLLGGVSVSQQDVSPSSLVLSSEYVHGAPQWRTDLVPGTPYGACGGGQIFGALVAAGGHMSTRKQAGVYLLDTADNAWLPLPSLQVPRSALSLVAFRGDLFAIGGSNRNGRWTSTVERLALSNCF